MQKQSIKVNLKVKMNYHRDNYLGIADLFIDLFVVIIK